MRSLSLVSFPGKLDNTCTGAQARGTGCKASLISKWRPDDLRYSLSVPCHASQTTGGLIFSTYDQPQYVHADMRVTSIICLPGCIIIHTIAAVTTPMPAMIPFHIQRAFRG